MAVKLLKEIGKMIRNAPPREVIKTGLSALDKKVGGMCGGDVWVVCGHTGKGKTSFLLNLLARQAQAGQFVALFSLEIGHEDVFNRYVQMHTGINERDLREGKFSPEEQAKVDEAHEKVGKLHVRIEDSQIIAPEEIRRRICEQAEDGASIIGIDYLQMLQGGDNRFMAITRAIKEIKAAAHEKTVPVVVLAQYNRRYADDDQNEPCHAWIDGSSEIAKASDLVLHIIHGDSPHCDLFIEKDRHGGNTGRITVKFDPIKSVFSNL